MIIPDFPNRPNGRDIAVLLRLERAITRLGLSRGFDGDPLAERYPEANTHGDLLAAHDLLQSIPCELHNFDRRLAHSMCQAAVFGRTRSHDRSLPPQPTAKPTANDKLARERSRRHTRRASA